jgi:hypothetical protein
MSDLMGPKKTKILSAIVAVAAAATSIPFTFVTFFTLLNALNVPTRLAALFALGCGFVGGVVVFASTYDHLCQRWSSEIDPPQFPPWSTRRIRDLFVF